MALLGRRPRVGLRPAALVEAAMGIFDRLKRLAKAEISEMKRVLSERDDVAETPQSRAAREEAEYHRNVRDAEAELAREHDDDAAADALTSQIEAGASLWGRAADDEGEATSAPRVEDEGASAWRERPKSRPYESRTESIPREVRDAYAALELPLGAQRSEVDRAFRDMLQRYHPDKHMNDARRSAMAHELTIRIREARDLLATWLASGKVE